MEIYLVGGAVRDTLLGLVPKEHDWVVVGATAEQLLHLGYKQVGRDFPVFLHPKSHDEYALARTERKTSPGYTGFEVFADPNVTLEQDLERRDLTINAIAQSEDGKLIDPFHGRRDLEQKLLRHVSPAFVEDPVRILRVARFAARFEGFTVAPQTLELMREMVNRGEVDALVPERVWKELSRALLMPQPQRFIEVLRDCGALTRLLPEVDRLFGVPQSPQHHPEVDTGIHTLLVLQQAARLSEDSRVRFAALLHDVGKGETPPELWPKHREHEAAGIPLVNALCQRFRVPNDHKDLALQVTRYHLFFHRALELSAEDILNLLQNLDAWRKPERYELFLLACEADARGRPGYETLDYPQGRVLRQALQAAQGISAQTLMQQGLKGAALGQAINRLRLEAIDTAICNTKSET
ncbi:MAG: multifunctional CCA addition/repair protein [Gammaproteobacteria bacterium]|nr:multifunctional CCA addition/repair protein [Gammaproteobacteria bacterium]MDH5801914.1 multifunctional CCA addition/repair protein [Gammaproteobacteria bacterium]